MNKYKNLLMNKYKNIKIKLLLINVYKFFKKNKQRN